MTTSTETPESCRVATLQTIADRLGIPVQRLTMGATPLMEAAIAAIQDAMAEARTAAPPAATDPVAQARAFLDTPQEQRIDGRTLRRRYKPDRPLTSAERNRLSRARKRGEVPTLEPKIYTQSDVDAAYQRGFEAGLKG